MNKVLFENQLLPNCNREEYAFLGFYISEKKTFLHICFWYVKVCLETFDISVMTDNYFYQRRYWNRAHLRFCVCLLLVGPCRKYWTNFDEIMIENETGSKVKFSILLAGFSDCFGRAIFTKGNHFCEALVIGGNVDVS